MTRDPSSGGCSWRKIGLIAAAVFAGMVLMLGVIGGMEWTNRTEFCISCHSMETNYRELQKSAHYTNRSGAHAQCRDCHVPREWGPKLVRKLFAVNDIVSEIRGTIDTPEKYEAKRGELAERVWKYMAASGSRECMTCHAYESMGGPKQSTAARQKHQDAAKDGRTCIACHKGVAHKLPPREE
ncbi:MAG: NapC/NirT family cytochrome c [Phaeospirillum sp.]|nr:NapC/NirT family cytochrome c [Phaeospirillum sp.]